MTGKKYPKDLVVLVADKNMEFSLRGILQRTKALGIGEIDFEIYQHILRDPGCFLNGHQTLLRFLNKFRHALVMLDREGCGRENKTREELESEIEARLVSSGWGNRAAAIVIDPELEIWVWSDSPEVDAALGWKGNSPSLRTWLENKGFFKDNYSKPDFPKKAVEEVLREVRKPRSASIYKQIADKVSLKRCKDPAFQKLKDKLVQWFAI